MAARLLLDAHLSRVLATMLQRCGIDAIAIQEWRAGVFLRKSDEEILRAAMEDNRILLSRDVSTIPEMLKEFARANVDHAGVIFISSKTFGSGALTPVADAIEALLADMADTDWRNCARFLPK